MIEKIIQYSVKNKKIVGIGVLLTVFMGLYSLTKISIDAVPDITNNQVQIITKCPNLSAETVEKFVTYPIEIAVSNLPKVANIRSISRFGLSVVTVVFKEQAGSYLPRQLIAERLKDINLATGFGSPTMAPISTGLGEIFQYTLTVHKKYKEKYTPQKLRTLQDWLIKRQLMGIEGVVEINAFGGGKKQYEISINPDILNATGLSLQDISNALASNNENVGGGYIEKDHKANFITGIGTVQKINDLKNCVVKIVNGLPITIGDIATVKTATATRYGAMTQDGKGEAVGGVVMMLKGSNAKKVISRVEKRIETLAKSLPAGVTITPFLNRKDFINRTTSTVQKNLIEGALIVIFVLVLLLGNVRGGLIVASTIPLSLLIAFILMNVFGVWANLMSLGAIDFGIIIDGAVIIVEATVFALYKKNIPPKIRDKITINAASGMMRTAFFGQLIILVVFLPILSLQGIEGKMFTPMALVFIFAMVGAMILCLTYVPMMSSWLLEKEENNYLSKSKKFLQYIEKSTQKPLEFAIKNPLKIIGATVVLFLVSLFVFKNLGGVFMPELDEGDIAFHAFLKPGSALSESIKTTTKIEKIIKKKFPEVVTVVSKIGVADIPTDPMPMDIADIFIILKPREQWVSAKSKDALIEKIKHSLEGVVGVNFEFTQPIEMRFNELITGAREDIAIKIYGEDLNILQEKANELAGLIEAIKGVADMKVGAGVGLPQISIHYQRDRLAKYGADIKTVNKTIAIALTGWKAGEIFEGEKVFDLLVRLEKNSRQNITDIKQIPLKINDQTTIPLQEVATIKYDTGLMQINRDAAMRNIVVGINVRGRDIQSLIKEIQAVVTKKMTLPTGYYIKYGGAFENFSKALKRLKWVVPLVLLLIFVLIYSALKSLRQTLMIFISIPLASIGGIFALWARGLPFSISAAVGFIVLFGVAVLNGLVLMSIFNELKNQGETSLKTIILKGVKLRIRPILLTALTDIFGFLPMAMATSSGAAVQRPLATVVIGGLISAGLLTIFILPMLYYQNYRKKNQSNRPKKWLGFIAVFCFFLGGITHAQTAEKITIKNIDQATAIAGTHYDYLRIFDLEIKKSKSLYTSAFDLGNTMVFRSGEELHSNALGITSWGIRQTDIALLQIPTKIKWAKMQTQKARSHQALEMGKFQRDIKKLWAKTVITYRKKNAYTAIKTVLDSLEMATEKAKKLGKISDIEAVMMRYQQQKLTLKIKQAQTDFKQLFTKLETYFPEGTRFDFNEAFTDLETTTKWSITAEKSDIENHVAYLYQAAVVKVATQRYKMAKANLLPKFMLRYTRQNIDGRSGFYGFLMGVQLPILSGKNLAALRLKKLATAQKTYALQWAQKTLNSKRKNAFTHYKNTLEKWRYYQREINPLEKKLQATAEKLLHQQQISYFDFAKYMQEVLDLKIDTLKAFADYVNAYFDALYYQ